MSPSSTSPEPTPDCAKSSSDRQRASAARLPNTRRLVSSDGLLRGRCGAQHDNVWIDIGIHRQWRRRGPCSRRHSRLAALSLRMLPLAGSTNAQPGVGIIGHRLDGLSRFHTQGLFCLVQGAVKNFHASAGPSSCRASRLGPCVRAHRWSRALPRDGRLRPSHELRLFGHDDLRCRFDKSVLRCECGGACMGGEHAAAYRVRAAVERIACVRLTLDHQDPRRLVFRHAGHRIWRRQVPANGSNRRDVLWGLPCVIRYAMCAPPETRTGTLCQGRSRTVRQRRGSLPQEADVIHVLCACGCRVVLAAVIPGSHERVGIHDDEAVWLASFSKPKPVSWRIPSPLPNVPCNASTAAVQGPVSRERRPSTCGRARRLARPFSRPCRLQVLAPCCILVGGVRPRTRQR